MDFDPDAPYGQLVESTLRVVTWNVWGRYGEFDVRDPLIEAELRRVDPDIVCLTESWATSDETLAARVMTALGHVDHRHFGALNDDAEWMSGIGISSRWPLAGVETHDLDDESGRRLGVLASARVDGPRGEISVYVAMLDYPLGASAVRQHQVRQILDLIAAGDRKAVTILCGDFNAGPDSDELRLLTGRSAGVNGLVFYDAWEVAGDGSAGITFSKDNPLAAPNLMPDRRFDYVLSAWPRAGGRGHPVRAKVIGTAESPKVPASDHYGVLADLRY